MSLKMYKPYYSDVGLLSMKAGVPAPNIIHNLRISDKMRGMLVENYVAQELHAKGIRPYYWVRKWNQIDSVVCIICALINTFCSVDMGGIEDGSREE